MDDVGSAAAGAAASASVSLAFDALPDPFLLLSPLRDESGGITDFTVVVANGHAWRSLGLAAPDGVGLTLAHLLPAAMLEQVRDWCSAVARSGEPLAVDDVPATAADGTACGWFDVRVTAATDAVGLSWRDVSDRHHAVEQLASSEAEYRLLADSATDVIIRTGLSRTIEWVSPSVTEVLGWRSEDLLGHTVAEFMHPGDLARLAQLMRELRDSGEPGGRFQSRFRTATGGWRWVSGAGRALRDESGRIVGGIDTLRDVQTEHDAEVALEASDAHFRLLAENTTDVVVQLTSDGRVAWASPSVERVLGWSIGQVVGRSSFDLLHPDDRSALTSLLANPDRSTSANGYAIRVRRSNGSYLWMEAATQHVPAAATSPASLVSRLRDIDAQRRAFSDLARSERRFRTAMDSAPIGMAVESMNGRLTELNSALCTMLGHSAQWLLSHPLLEVVHREDEWTYRELRARAYDAGVASAMQELRLQAADGRLLLVQLALGVMRDEMDLPTSFVWQILDVTETRRAQDQLEFLAAHDPLTNVKNRRALMDDMSACLPGRGGTESVVAVLYADIDGLKPVNDQLGHAAGDALIKAVASRFDRALGQHEATIGRLGGDEFVALLVGLSGLEEAAAVAERVRSVISEPLDIEGTLVNPAVSIGVACAGPDDGPDDLLRRADSALLRAKKSGGGQVEVAQAAVNRP